MKMKTQKNISEIMSFNNIGAAYLEKNKEAENKICASIKNIQAKQIKKVTDQFNDDLDNARLDCCATDSNGIIIRDAEKNYQFTPDGIRKLKSLVKEINAKKYELYSRIADGIEPLIKLLTEEEKTAFSGFVIPEIPTDENDTE